MRSENSPKHTHIMTSQTPLFMRFRFFGFSRCSLVVRCLFYCAANSAFLTASSPLRCIFVGSYTRACNEGAKFPFMGVAFVAISPSSLRVQHGCNLNRFVTASGVNRALNTQAQRSTHEAAFFNCWACVSAALKSVCC